MPRLFALLIAMSLACTAPLGGRDQAPAERAAGVQPQDGIQVIDHVAPKRDSTGPRPSRFEWTAAKGADQYVISLWNDIDVLLYRQYLDATKVDWPEKLVLDEGTYFWDVNALRGGEIIGTSGRSAFVILDRK